MEMQAEKRPETNGWGQRQDLQHITKEFNFIVDIKVILCGDASQLLKEITPRKEVHRETDQLQVLMS